MAVFGFALLEAGVEPLPRSAIFNFQPSFGLLLTSSGRSHLMCLRGAVDQMVCLHAAGVMDVILQCTLSGEWGWMGPVLGVGHCKCFRKTVD